MNTNNSQNFLLFQSVGIGQHNKGEKSEVFTPLKKDTLHLWSARYSDLDSHLSFAGNFLSQQEREKSFTFIRPVDARHFVLRHGMVRFILARYSQTGPELLPVVYDTRGKPGLDLHSDFHELSFSLSHSDQVVSVGIVMNHSIGIDIVKINPDFPFHEIYEYLFTPMEKEVIREIPPKQRYLMFFKIWALKEAIVKATGDGIRLMGSTDVTSVIKDSCQVSSHRIKINEKTRNFSICQFSPVQSYLGAAAVCLDP